MKELKPCQFCGGKVHAAYHNKVDGYYLVVCSKCFARSVGETIDEAVEAWNRRTE